MYLATQQKINFFCTRALFHKKKGVLLQHFFSQIKKKTWYEPHEGQIVNGMRGAFFHMLLFPHMQACIQGYITYEGGGVQQCKREQALAHAPPTRFGETARDSPGASYSLHMWLMGKTRQIIVGRPIVHYNQNLKFLAKNYWTLLPVEILSTVVCILVRIQPF